MKEEIKLHLISDVERGLIWYCTSLMVVCLMEMLLVKKQSTRIQEGEI
jgi:hypothetical protein